MDSAATPQTIAQQIQSITNHSVFTRIIRRRLQQTGRYSRRLLLHLPLTGNYRSLSRKWCKERGTWTTEWYDIVFIGESRFRLQYHDGRIQVWRHHGERLLNCCVMHRHTSPVLCIRVWGGIAFHCRTPLVYTVGKCMSPWSSYTFRAGHQSYSNRVYNARPHMSRSIQEFFFTHQIELRS
ncbi:transposable element Tcb1 transposase [Trichonephila clavipes]|nr:transposable element Tcb1 transposase [Trichonephila clavipes]